MGRREENKHRKRADLEAAALALFGKQGFHATSVEQIVAGAGLARGTFYLYFSDKEGIFQAIVGGLLDRVGDALVDARRALEASSDTTASALAYEELGLRLIEVVGENREAALLYYREQRDPGSVGAWIRGRAVHLEGFVEDTVASLMQRGLLRSADPRMTAMAILGAVDHLVLAWLEGRFYGDPVRVGLELVELFGAGLVARER
jgi:AcrR family transcriptional regulator